MPVSRHEAHRGELVFLEPLRGFAGIAARIDREVAELDAALHHPPRDIEFGGEFGGGHIGIDARDEHFARQPLLYHIQAARDPARPARQHDHRIGLLIRGRLGQRDGKAEKTERIDEHDGSEEAEDHNIFLSDASTVNRAV